MLVKEFLEAVGSGDFTNIDIRNYFASLKDIDKKDLLSELQISAMAEDICGHSEKAGRLYEAQEMLCSIYNIGAHEFSGELYTEVAQKAFTKAIAKGWMIKQSTGGYKWLGTDGGAKKAELAYLCARIYGYKYSPNNGNAGDNVPYEALNKLFGVTRLDRAMQQVFEAKKPQLWRKTIDKIFQD